MLTRAIASGAADKGSQTSFNGVIFYFDTGKGTSELPVKSATEVTEWEANGTGIVFFPEWSEWRRHHLTSIHTCGTHTNTHCECRVWHRAAVWSRPVVAAVQRDVTGFARCACHTLCSTCSFALTPHCTHTNTHVHEQTPTYVRIDSAYVVHRCTKTHTHARSKSSPSQPLTAATTGG